MGKKNKPYVICHMMMTIDGKIASGWSGADIMGDYFDLYTKTEDQLKAKAWMCGRVTMKMFASTSEEKLPKLDKEINHEDYIGSFSNELFFFGIDTKGLLRWEKNTIKLSNVSEKINLVLIVTEKTPQEYLFYLQSKGVSYIFVGKDEVDFELLLEKLHNIFHIERLLLEGGGLLNGSMMAANCVDEISLLLSPMILNKKDAPSVFEKKDVTKLDIKKYKLLEFKQMEKEAVWFRYKK